MKRAALSASIAAFLLSHIVQAASATSDGKLFWPQWRGPLASGFAPLADPPMNWSETNHIKWKVKVPGEGDSTPIIWEERVFILTAIPLGRKANVKDAGAESSTGGEAPERRNRFGRGGFGSEAPKETYQFVALCYDRKTGKVLWQKIAREEVPHEGHQANNTFASASAVTDGQLVLAYFGSRGLHCYDLEGNLKWSKDFGHMQTRNGFGEGASPALHGDKVIIAWDHEGDDFIVALDKSTGKELWRASRDEATGWSTPLVVSSGGKQQVVVNATGKVRSYDFDNGKEIWSCAGQTANAIPSPVATLDTVYVTSGFRGSALYAIRLDRTGDLTGTDAIRWSHNKNTPYVPSPLLVDDLLYVVANNDGKLSCLDAKTGNAHFEAERLAGIYGIYASPVAAKDRVYVFGREGACLVLKKGPKLEILATNKLDDKTDASPAAAGNELFVRGHQNLYCIAEK